MSDAEPTIESIYLVYRYGDGITEGELTIARRLFVRHQIGESVTREMVLDQMDIELHDFKPGRYRLVPDDRIVDVTVTAKVAFA